MIPCSFSSRLELDQARYLFSSRALIRWSKKAGPSGPPLPSATWSPLRLFSILYFFLSVRYFCFFSLEHSGSVDLCLSETIPFCLIYLSQHLWQAFLHRFCTWTCMNDVARCLLDGLASWQEMYRMSHPPNLSASFRHSWWMVLLQCMCFLEHYRGSYSPSNQVWIGHVHSGFPCMCCLRWRFGAKRYILLTDMATHAREYSWEITSIFEMALDSFHC